MKNKITHIILFLFAVLSIAQAQDTDSTKVYKKRVLETTEIEFLSSYYSQDGNNAAVSGGVGSEELTDIHPTIVVAVPLNADDVLSLELGVSVYSSASSSNLNPFDGNNIANPFQASSGASSGDTWLNGALSYSHSSDDRNTIWSGNLSVATEYDYTSIGGGGSFTKLFNEKNTELSFKANVYIDNWKDLYPFELRSFDGGNGLDANLFSRYTITGNQAYNPKFTRISSTGRNSYSVGLGFSQILSRNMQASLSLDLVQQTGLLSTPFQRVYFSDVENSFIEEFHLADDIERLPDSRFKIAVGGRLHYFLNERFVLRTFYRYYLDDWGITSHTAKVELPIKLTNKFTLTPAYRFYTQTAADHFAPYDQHLSTSDFYTSDYDLSGYNANQYSLGFTYTDVFTKAKILNWGLKSLDLNVNYYDRNTSFSAYMIAVGVKFVRQ